MLTLEVMELLCREPTLTTVEAVTESGGRPPGDRGYYPPVSPSPVKPYTYTGDVTAGAGPPGTPPARSAGR